MAKFLVVKAGRLANGFSLDSGNVVHIVDSERIPYLKAAFCGTKPAIQWTDVSDGVLNMKVCPKCKKKAEAYYG